MTRRKIHIGDKVYEYYIGRGLSVVIWLPDGKKVVVDASELTGRTWDVIDRGQWKKTSDGWIQPAHVRDYILSNLT